jgi:hypothetical protein
MYFLFLKFVSISILRIVFGKICIPCYTLCKMKENYFTKDILARNTSDCLTRKRPSVLNGTFQCSGRFARCQLVS